MLWQNLHSFPNRTDLMSLSTITEKDAPSKQKKPAQRPIFSLRTDDIEGAQPAIRGYQHINKPEYSNYTQDIEKAFPRTLHPDLTKPCRYLSTNDIEKAQPKGPAFKPRNTNPLNPEYKLPFSEQRPVTPPKFIRNSINTDDIDGAKPEKYLKWHKRDSTGTADIEGARPKPEKIWQKPNFMEVKDINGSRFATNRLTNPLEPSYNVVDEGGKVVEIGFIEGSKNKPQINLEKEVHRRNFDNDDIDGSKANSLGHPTLRNSVRNYSKNPMDTSDIPGSSAGTHRRGLTTSRITNPLEPVYVWTVEDPIPIEKEKPKTIEKNEENNENVLRFWGVTPAASSQSSRPVSRPQTSKPRPPGFQRNQEKFYDAESGSFLCRNLEKFFENSSHNLSDRFLNAQNAKTIHKKKKEISVIEPRHFQENQKKFYGDGTGRSVSSGNYKFKLSRGEIGKPK